MPTPDGRDPDSVTCTFELDYIRSDDFKAMYEAENDLEPEQKTWMGNADEIIANTRKGKLDGFLFPDWFVAMNLSGGYDKRLMSNRSMYNEIARRTGNPHAPVNVPVLWCYFQNEHVCLANGDTIVRHDTGSLHSLTCPIVKWTLVPDSNRWAPRSDVDAGRDTADGKNVMVNAILDLMTYTLHPTAVKNKQLIQGDQDVGLEPHQTIDAYGDASRALAYVAPPPIPNGVLNVVDLLSSEHDDAVGQPGQLRGQGTSGLMRGGMHGFESFLQTSFARQKLAGDVVVNSSMKKQISLVIIYEQARMQSPESYIVRDPDNETNFIEKTITPQELRHVFAVKLDVEDKFMRSPVDRNMDLQIAPILLKDPRYDWQAVTEEFLLGGNHRRMRKIMAAPEVVEQQSAQLKQMQEAEQKKDENMTAQAERGQESQA